MALLPGCFQFLQERNHLISHNLASLQQDGMPVAGQHGLYLLVKARIAAAIIFASQHLLQNSHLVQLWRPVPFRPSVSLMLLPPCLRQVPDQ